MAAEKTSQVAFFIDRGDVDSVYFALRTRAERCEERAFNPATEPGRAQENREESARCNLLAVRLLAASRQ
jgi:hypothetical protein